MIRTKKRSRKLNKEECEQIAREMVYTMNYLGFEFIKAEAENRKDGEKPEFIVYDEQIHDMFHSLLTV